jgi:RNA polymerase sigma-B factor
MLRWRRNGDEGARGELCERFLPVARRYRKPHEPFEDLVQVACVGLLGAIDRFDPDRGDSFTGFAVPTILGELKRYFRDTGWSAHVPRGALELALLVDRGFREISALSGHTAQVQELATYLELDVEDVLVGLDAATARYSASLDAPAAAMEADEQPSLVDTLGAVDDRFGLVETKLSLSAAIPRLPHLERRAMAMHACRGLKQHEIARELGCSQMQVSRLLSRGAQRLRTLTNLA